MSGGVDSSVVAFLLKKEGYDVTGVFMRCYNIDGCAERDAEDARRVAEKLGIPFYTFDFEEEYKRDVVNYMVEGYRAGITPNPDVMCNKVIKFGLFLKKAKELGADYIATGHYVRLEKLRFTKSRGFVPQRGTHHSTLNLARSADVFESGSRNAAELGFQSAEEQREIGSVRAQSVARRRNETTGGDRKNIGGAPSPLGLRDAFPINEVSPRFSLYEAKDKNKDQSYFLWTLTQVQLQYCLFPIGDYLKSEVRAIAKEAGLPTAEKKDSQGICFLGAVTLDEFLKQYIPEKRGEVLTTTGKKIGEHEGAHFYTIGQRHGLNLSAKSRELGVSGAHKTEAHYVASKNIIENKVIVAEGENNPALFRNSVTLKKINFISGDLNLPAKVKARVRYRQMLSDAMLENKEEEYVLTFEKPQKFVAEGQSAVFYDESGMMLGGGVIV